MKNKLLLGFLLFCAFTSAQNYTTNFIELSGTTFRVKFDTNPTTVTMTMVGPSANGYAVGLGMTSMFTAGGDCAFVSGASVAAATLSDRRFSGSGAQPALDSAPNNWTVTSNVVASGVRTLIATRALNTGDTAGGDFVFTNGPSTIDLIWALGSSITFTSHSSIGNGVSANFVLSTDSFYLAGFKMYPNPADEIFAIDLPNGTETVEVKLYDILGKLVLEKTITKLENKIITNTLNSGNYIVKVHTDLGVSNTKFIKE